MVRLLKAQGATLAVAESCTAEPGRHHGCSGASYSRGRLLVYTDAQKMGLLGIAPSGSGAHSAVSEEVALDLAANMMESAPARTTRYP